MLQYIKNKRVLFITTKNPDYIRNTQEIALITEHAATYTVIASVHTSYPRRLLSVYRRLLTTHMDNFDTVFLGFAPQLILPLFAWKFKNVNIVEDFFISMYDTLCCDRCKFRPDSYAGRLLHKIDTQTLACADAVFCDTHAHAQYFTDEFQADPDKLITMYLHADTSIYHPMTVTRPDELKDKCIVLYFGSILPFQGIDTVLDAFRLLDNYSNLYFICIGPIQDDKLSTPRPVSDSIRYIDWLPQEELARYIAMADLCLAGHFNGTIGKARRTIPMNAYICQAMQKPMILGDNAANHELFREDSNILFAEMGNSHALANQIIAFGRTRCNKQPTSF